MKNMHMLELKEIYQSLHAGEVVLDCRTAAEYQDGHLAGSVNISHESLGQHLDELKKYKKIYLHCRSGGRVQTAAMELSQSPVADRMVYITRSGFKDWAA